MIPDRPGLWWLRLADGEIQKVVLAWVRHGDGRRSLEPLGRPEPDLTLEALSAKGTWVGKEDDYP